MLVWIQNAFAFVNRLRFLCGNRNLQVWILANFSLKLGPMALFIHLKIILLQCFRFSVFGFQFSAISSIQTNPKIYMKTRYMHTYVVRIFLNAAKLRYPVYTHSMMMWLQQPNWTFFKRKGNSKIVAIWDNIFPIYFPYTLFWNRKWILESFRS